jgi:hypothetical protein
VVIHVNSFDDQDSPLLLDLPPGVAHQPTVAGGNFTRLQRASKGPGQSAGGSGHQVVQRGCVRLVDMGVHTVVLSDLGVHSEKHRGGDMRQVGAPQGALTRSILTRDV